MASPSYVLALDQGTTSSRAMAFDAGGRPLASAGRELAQIYPDDGWVEHDPKAIWHDTINCAREVVAELEAGGLKDMGRVMGELKSRYTGRMDFSKASAAVKELLS